MESAAEAERLLSQEDAIETRSRLLAAGLARGHRALDAGCGPGGVSFEMSQLVGAEGSVVGLDASPDRVAQARGLWERQAPNLRFHRGDVRESGLPAEAFDFVWSQFVFEYLPDPAAALRELVRVTAPGGRIAVADIDGLGLANWPMPTALQRSLETLGQALAATGFDPHIGRKVFSLFKATGLRNVRVRLSPFYIAAGAADARLQRDWQTRFDTISPIGIKALGAQAYGALVADFLNLLQEESALKYAVVLTTEGVKP